MIARHTPLKRSQKPIAKRRAKPRRGPMRCPEYRRWLTGQRCIACIVEGIAYTRDSDPAHTINNGMRSKGPDSSCVPLCRLHHEEYDAGREVFEKKYRLTMRLIAPIWYALFQTWGGFV